MLLDISRRMSPSIHIDRYLGGNAILSATATIPTPCASKLELARQGNTTWTQGKQTMFYRWTARPTDRQQRF